MAVAGTLLLAFGVLSLGIVCFLQTRKNNKRISAALDSQNNA